MQQNIQLQAGGWQGIAPRITQDPLKLLEQQNRSLATTMTPVFGTAQTDVTIQIQPKEKKNLNPLQAKRLIDKQDELDILMIELTLYSDEDIQKMGAIPIDKSSLIGVSGDLMDPFMGPIEDNEICPTCDFYNDTCPGHYGVVTLKRPILRPHYIPHIRHILQSVCKDCYHCLLNLEQQKKEGIDKLTGYAKLKANSNVCKDSSKPKGKDKKTARFQCLRHAHAQNQQTVAIPDLNNLYGPSIQVTKEVKTCSPNPIYKVEKKSSHSDLPYIAVVGEDGKSFEMPVDKIIEILRGIPDEEAKLLGFELSHPRDLVVTRILVPPPCSIPYITIDGVKQVDHITKQFQHLIDENNKLDEISTERGSLLNVSEIRTNIAKHYWLMINNDKEKDTNGRKQMTIKQKIQGKRAMIRGIMMGKRVIFAGRTVLSPDPTLAFDEVRVPDWFAKRMSIPVVVFNANLDKMREMFKKGKINKITFRPDITDGEYKRFSGTTFKVTKDLMDTYIPQIGDTLHRQLIEGDYIVFNRQPTISRTSMMGYRVVIKKADTFGMNLTATTPHNADFDGDEGNVHVGQTIKVHVEIEILMSIEENMMSDRNNRPLIGVVYDSLSAAYKLCRVFSTYLYSNEETGLLIKRISEDKVDKFYCGSILERQTISSSELGDLKDLYPQNWDKFEQKAEIQTKHKTLNKHELSLEEREMFNVPFKELPDHFTAEELSCKQEKQIEKLVDKKTVVGYLCKEKKGFILWDSKLHDLSLIIPEVYNYTDCYGRIMFWTFNYGNDEFVIKKIDGEEIMTLSKVPEKIVSRSIIVNVPASTVIKIAEDGSKYEEEVPEHTTVNRVYLVDPETVIEDDEVYVRGEPHKRIDPYNKTPVTYLDEIGASKDHFFQLIMSLGSDHTYLQTEEWFVNGSDVILKRPEMVTIDDITMINGVPATSQHVMQTVIKKIGRLVDGKIVRFRNSLRDEEVLSDLPEDCRFLKRSIFGGFYERCQKHGINPSSGRGIFSILLPPDMVYEKGDVEIKDGILLKGVIKKGHIGPSSQSIIQHLWIKYGKVVTGKFISQAQWLLKYWLGKEAFSIGIDDCFPETDYESHKAFIQEAIEDAKMKIRSLGGKRDNPLDEERREDQINAYLNSVRDQLAVKGLQNMSFTNNLRVSTDSGAKGSNFNVAQISNSVGQQFLLGSRMPMEVTAGKRCLPFFERNSDEPEDRGFIVNSFIEGLNPAEMAMLSIAGREGTINTAIKTADTGIEERKMVKAGEDIQVANDKTVTNVQGVVLQPVYAYTGMNPAAIMDVKTTYGTLPSFIDVSMLNELNYKYQNLDNE